MHDASHLLLDPRIPPRLWRRIDVAPCGCWLWNQGTDADGYPGRIRLDGERWQPYRLFYVQLVGPIPEGLQIGHQCHSLNLATCAGGSTCQHRRCVNPLDVAPETNRENLLGGNTFQRRNALVEECPKGHAYTPENITWVTLATGSRARACRTCGNERSRGYWHSTRKAAERQARRAAGYRGGWDETSTCVNGHTKTPATTYVSPAGNRACTVCRREAARRSAARRAPARG